MSKRKLRNVFQAAVAIVLSISLLVPAVPIWAAEEENAQYDSIDGLSGEILYDTSGSRVMACGGEVHQFTEDGETKWYWFGVDDLEKAEGEQKVEGIHLYSSSDLYNWDYEGVMWNIEGSAHPKILYNQAQKDYVMWVSNAQGKVSIGTSSSIKGPFTTVSESVDDNIIGFFNLYEERSGTAYVIYAGYSSGFGVARLSGDYKGIEGQGQQLQFEGESFINPEGGIFKRDNKYYIVNAGMTQYAAADSLTGMWEVNTLQMWDGTAYKDIVDKNQTSSVFRVKTKTAEEYVCIGDSVGGESGEVRYIWLPLIFSEDGKVALRELSNWKLEKKDGEEDEQLATEADKAALMTYINKFVAGITDDEEYEVSYPAAARTAFAADVAQVKGKTITTLQDIEEAKQELQRAAAALKETYIKPYAGKTADIRELEEQITAAGNLLTEENKAKDENAYHTLKNARQTAEAAKNTALTTEVTKDQVTGATAALQEAITTFNNAMAVADARIVLAAAIAEADEIMDQEQCYTADSWQEFEEAYEAANAVTPTMTADEINTAAASLKAARSSWYW